MNSMSGMAEDVLRQQSGNTVGINMEHRKAEEAAERRNEAASWLRQTVGPVGARDLPEQPSEEEFRVGLRNGIILCNALNKVQPATIPKVVEAPAHTPIEGAALCAYQYFENVRNFLVALEDLGLPIFVASDLEKGGEVARIVNSVLALKSFSESKATGRQGSSRFSTSTKPSGVGRYFVRRHVEPFMNSSSRSQPADLSVEQNLSINFSIEANEMTTSHSLNMLVRTILSERRPEEVPLVVESILSNVMQEFEHRRSIQNDLVKTAVKDLNDTNSINRAHASPEMSSDSLTKMPGGLMKDGKPYVQFDSRQRELQELKKNLLSIRHGVENLRSQYTQELANLDKHLHALYHVASNYHKVLDENRRLYNQVQDLKGNIRVYCRVRPFLPGQITTPSIIAEIDGGNITVSTPVRNGKDGNKCFTFNKIFGPSTKQEEVFSDMQPLIRSVLDGYNVCIFAYGQTGSGKTYTMMGPKVLTEETVGVNYRALNDLFHLSEQRKDTFKYEITVQMIEIYNEQVRDLLVDGVNKRVEIRSTSQKGYAVPDASLISVASPSEVVELMNMGQKNRATGATALNDRSSRSHSCLTIHVQGKELASGTILRGCMHLVDLAGSERVDKSEARGDRLKEAQHINKSLSALGDVIASLAQKNSHVPYRNSKLTQLLQDSLGGQAKTLMFIHISPESDAISETLSTLKFAERVANVELGAARVNKETGEIKELKEQIASLKAALSRKEDSEQVRVADVCRSGVARHRQPMDEVGNFEEPTSGVAAKQKSALDHSDAMEENIFWLESCTDLQSRDEKDNSSGVWVDKLVVDNNCKNLLEWDQRNGFSSAALHQQAYEAQSIRIYDSDDNQELGTSNSSDEEQSVQSRVSRSMATANGGVSSMQKHQAGPLSVRGTSKVSESAQSKKLLKRQSHTPKRNVRQHATGYADVKRTPSGRFNSIAEYKHG